MNDYQKAKWKLTGMYILVFFVLLNLFTISLFVILQKVEEDYTQKTEVVWQKKQIFLPGSNVTVLEWSNNNEIDKQSIIDLHRTFLEDIRKWIVIVESVLLVLAGFTSYFLAGRTLKPIQYKNELQRQFLADVSHELKNPLSALKTSLEIAARQKHWSDGEVHEIFDDLEEEVTRLTQTTQDLVALEQIDEARITKQQNISNIVHNQISLLKSYASKRNIFIKEDLNDFVCQVNIRDVEQVVFNLVHNAIKFSLPNGKVYVSLSSKGELRIKDEGIGIMQKDLNHIFDRFYKVDSSRTFDDNNGSGLGLAIVRKIVDKNNWKIFVTSKKDEGTTFRVQF
jgi:signal transduction histidine kinase